MRADYANRKTSNFADVAQISMLILSGSIFGRDDDQDLVPGDAVQPHLVLGVPAETHAQLRARREKLSPAVTGILGLSSPWKPLREDHHLLERWAVLEGEGAQVYA